MKPLSELLAEVEAEDIIYATEFKNQFDSWQLLHATRSRIKAFDDAGRSGRVVEAIDRATYDKFKAVAVELAKALEFYSKHHHHLHTTAPNFANEALTTVRKLMGD